MRSGQIFISHATKDDEFVKELRQALEGQGLAVWVDSRNLHAGDRCGATEEPVGVRVQLTVGGLSDALPAILAALGEQLPDDMQPFQAAQSQPVEELLLELSDRPEDPGRGGQAARLGDRHADLLHRAARPDRGRRAALVPGELLPLADRRLPGVRRASRRSCRSGAGRCTRPRSEHKPPKRP
jgi:hypothetical protein